MVRLEDLSDKDLAEFKTKFDDPFQEIITNEQLRRERNETLVVPCAKNAGIYGGGKKYDPVESITIIDEYPHDRQELEDPIL